MRSKVIFGGSGVLALTLLLATAYADGPAGVAGHFKVNNTLPEGASFRVELWPQGAGEAVATHDGAVENKTVPFDFSGVGSGSFTVRLVATWDESVLRLGSGTVELGAEEPGSTDLELPAIGTDATLAGTVEVSGELPADLMVFVSARRIDMKHASYMPDGINNASYDVSKDDFEGSHLAFRFERLSYGVYQVQLMGYDLTTHQTHTFGEYPGSITLDADRRESSDVRFEAMFEPPATKSN